MFEWIARILPTARGILGRRADALPPAVAATVRRQDRSSEVLIRLIQLGVVLLLGTLYLASPKTDTETTFRVVPYALAIYMALTIFGLIWSWRTELPNWAVLGSILFDISLLMMLIWSFHLQYGQPASFYLKVPTFLYVFIFIALRALRFEPWFVLAAGLTASAGWVVLVAYVAFSEPMDSMITRDYVHYLTSNSVLIGAEIDKVVSILVVTAILWLALHRARRLLVTSVAEQAAAENLSRFFDAPVAMQIRGAEGDDLSRGTKRDAAILFVDMRGFTRMATNLEPAAVIGILRAYQQCVVPLIQARGGSIDKFLGDGIMATFGAVYETKTYARDALEAIDAIMAEAASWFGSQGPLAGLHPRPVGAAVAAGAVVFGTVGDGTRLEFTVIGPAVNLAAKLEKQNKALGSRAVTTLEVFQLARSQGYAMHTPAEVKTGAVEGTGESYDLAVLHH